MTITTMPKVWRAERQIARIAIVLVCLYLPIGALVSASAQDAVGGVIGAIRIEGTQRVEPETVRSYMLVQPGDLFDLDKIDRSVKSLFATGLFADVTLQREDGTLVVHVVENPVVNRITFKGNKKLSVDRLENEIRLRPRTVYTSAKLASDVTRLLDIYRRYSPVAARVEPKVIPLEQNRVDLVFEIDEGSITDIRIVNFVGNHVFDSNRLREAIRSKVSRWYRPKSDSSYDPDRLADDRELLRKLYLSEGYADFRVVSAVADPTPRRDGLVITFTVEEGERYKFGNVGVTLAAKDISIQELKPLVTIREGGWYNVDQADKTMSALTEALENRGCGFVVPHAERNVDAHTMDVSFDIKEAPCVYIERIAIIGNVSTRDEVITRELLFKIDDAFKISRLQRSEQRLRNLGLFKSVDITANSGSGADKAVSVNVKEKVTGSATGFVNVVSSEGPSVGFNLQELNFMGRGQSVLAKLEFTRTATKAEISFTEPYFAYLPDRHLPGKWGFQFSTGSSANWTTPIAGFQLTMWVGLLVFRMPLVLLILLVGAYYAHLWSGDQSRARRQFRRTMDACKATILTQVSYFAVSNVLQTLGVGSYVAKIASRLLYG